MFVDASICMSPAYIPITAERGHEKYITHGLWDFICGTIDTQPSTIATTYHVNEISHNIFVAFVQHLGADPLRCRWFPVGIEFCKELVP